jgi:hypothetical protein
MTNEQLAILLYRIEKQLWSVYFGVYNDMVPREGAEMVKHSILYHSEEKSTPRCMEDFRDIINSIKLDAKILEGE